MIERAGFVGTRFKGTDGVSLETEKWARVLERMNISSCYFSGLSDRPDDCSMVSPLAFFGHPDVERLHAQCFAGRVRPPALTAEAHAMRESLKKDLHAFLRRFQPDVLIAENALAIPMNIPLALAITEVVAETGIRCIGHHHDFAWERDRFRVNCVDDWLAAAFPPRLPSMRHAVINTEARRQAALRAGISSVVVPNVFDFATPAPGLDDYNRTLREELGIGDGELLVLQPTRMIARKGIEHALELVQRLAGEMGDRPIRFVIPHQELDEGDGYSNRIRDYAALLGVSLLTRPDRIDLARRTNPDGSRVYSLWDLYVHADFVTYPSLYEGFGNAFVEAVYFRKPLLVNRYSVYRDDIEPLGFKAVMMDGYLTPDTVREVAALLADPARQAEWADRNYELAHRHFSYQVLETRLRELLADW